MNMQETNTNPDMRWLTTMLFILVVVASLVAPNAWAKEVDSDPAVALTDGELP